jgi:hypothetical protein
MSEITLGIGGSLPVYLASIEGVPIEDVAFDDVTECWLRKEGGSEEAFALTAGNWDEIGSGHYEIAIGATESDTLGNLHYHVAAPLAIGYPGIATVVAASVIGKIQTYTLTIGAAPCIGAHILVTSDAAGAAPVDEGYTDESGQFKFIGKVGKTYYIWRQKPGVIRWSPANPDIEVGE